MMKSFFAKLEQEADKKYVLFVLAFIAFLESIIFPIPIDILTFGLSAVQPKKWFRFATVATLFSVVGAIGGYMLGFYFFDRFGTKMIDFYGYQEQFLTVKEMFHQNIFLVMFVSAFTPIPYKVFTITGGMLKVAFTPFVIASLLGRGLRFYLEAYLAFRFGKTLAEHIMKKINWYSLIFVLLTVFYFVFK